MCGRFVITLTWQELVDLSRAATLSGEPMVLPQFNIAPLRSIPVIRAGDGARSLSMMRWGFVPHWAKEDIGAKMINARAETVSEKPSFRDAFTKTRCIIPANGFYEWRREGRGRRPYFFKRADGKPMLFAGLWAANSQLSLETCAIVTTEASADVAPVHHRMPVILDNGDVDGWLNDGMDGANERLRAFAVNGIARHPVSAAVNKAGAQGPHLIAPVPPEPETLSLF